MIYLDTNIVLRYLLDDNIELSAKAKLLIDSNSNLYICEAVFAEIVYVLQKVYKVERKLIEETISELLEKENINTSNNEIFCKSLELFSTKNLDFIDCLLCAYNHVNSIQVETFDIKLMKLLKK
jgi:predicted nucleic-acid-binding protein